MPNSLKMVENPLLDRDGEWAMRMIREGLPDRSYLSETWIAETRVNGRRSASSTSTTR